MQTLMGVAETAQAGKNGMHVRLGEEKCWIEDQLRGKMRPGEIVERKLRAAMQPVSLAPAKFGSSRTLRIRPPRQPRCEPVMSRSSQESVHTSLAGPAVPLVVPPAIPVGRHYEEFESSGVDTVDESSEESFPASDPPAPDPLLGPGRPAPR